MVNEPSSPELIDIDHRSLDIDLRVCCNIDICLCLQLDVECAQRNFCGLGGDFDIPRRLYLDLVLRATDLDFVVTGLIDDLNLLASRTVVQAHHVTTARLYAAVVVRS